MKNFLCFLLGYIECDFSGNIKKVLVVIRCFMQKNKKKKFLKFLGIDKK